VEARLCAKLRRVYRDVMAEYANLLVCFGDKFGEKLMSSSSSVIPTVPGNTGSYSTTMTVTLLLYVIVIIIWHPSKAHDTTNQTTHHRQPGIRSCSRAHVEQSATRCHFSQLTTENFSCPELISLALVLF